MPLDPNMREMYSIEAYFKNMRIDDPSIEAEEGAVDDEVEYILENTGKYVKHYSHEASLRTEAAFQRRIYMSSLSLNTSGNQSKFSIQSAMHCQYADHYLCEKVKESRYVTDKLSNVVKEESVPELVDIYLFEQFLVHTLPASIIPFSRQLFFGTSWSRNNENSTLATVYLNYGVAFLYIVFVFCLFFCIIYAGLAFGSLSSYSWLIAVCVNILCDIVIQSPLSIFIIEILLAKALVTEMRKVHLQIHHRFEDISARATKYVSSCVNVIQHLNPACRCARQSEIRGAPMIRFLMSLEDLDLPYNHLGDGSIRIILEWVLSSAAVVYLILILSLTPRQFQDVAIDVSISVIAPVFVAVFYLLLQVSVFLPFAIFFCLIFIITAVVVVDKYSQLSAVTEGKSAYVSPSTQGNSTYTEDDLRVLRSLLLPKLERIESRPGSVSLDDGNWASQSLATHSLSSHDRVRSAKWISSGKVVPVDAMFNYSFSSYEDHPVMSRDLEGGSSSVVSHFSGQRNTSGGLLQSHSTAVTPGGDSSIFGEDSQILNVRPYNGAGSPEVQDGSQKFNREQFGEDSMMSFTNFDSVLQNQTTPPNVGYELGDGGSVNTRTRLVPISPSNKQNRSASKSGKSEMQVDEYKRYTKIIAVYLRDEVSVFTCILITVLYTLFFAIIDCRSGKLWENTIWLIKVAKI